MLNRLPGQLVVDQTGLRGYYDFDLKWVGDGEKSPAAFGTPDFVVGAISVLRRDVGLEVTKATVPVTLWRVTHLEQPTEN